MTKKEYMKIIMRCAGDYYRGVLPSIKVSNHRNNLNKIDFRMINLTPEFSQRFAEAVIIDFVNFVGQWHGLDWDFRAKHLAEEREKNKKLENDKNKN